MIKLKYSGMIANFIRKWNGYPGSDLCTLFWQVTGRVVGLLLSGVAIGTYFIGGAMVYLDWGYSYVHPTEIWFIFGSVLAVCASIVIAMIMFVDTAISDRWTENIATLAEAIHDKYCPLVEWKEDEK